MLIIDNFLASIEVPGEWVGIDLENNYIRDDVADCFYIIILRSGNAFFDTFGMHKDLDGLKLLNGLLAHFAEKEDYRRCKLIKIRKEQYIRLMGYFDRCRREKRERVRKKNIRRK